MEREDWWVLATRVSDVLLLDPENDTARRWRALVERRIPQQAGTRAADPVVRAERRLLTVMFCDLVGSTSMSQILEPEALHELYQLYRAHSEEQIRRVDGHIAQFMGDGFLAFFGYPIPHEDAAYRAVAAGLELCGVVTRLAAEVKRRFAVDLKIRVAIHTGLVVVSDMSSRTWIHPNDIVGETPNLAAGLEAKAAPNTVLMTDSTYDLVRRLVEVEPLGPQELHGLARSVNAYRAVRLTSVYSRYRARLDRTARLVGRSTELALLGGMMDGPAKDRAQVVLVVGEAGIGKSRLMDEVCRRAKGRQVLECYCSELARNVALRPILRLVARVAGLETWDDPTVRYAKLERALASQLRSPVALARIAAALEAPAPSGLAPKVTPEQALEETLDALAGWLVSRSAAHRLVLVVDDVHWIDPTTRAFLERLAASAPGLLLLMASRPDTDLHWAAEMRAAQIRLTELSSAEAAELIRGLPGAGDFAPEHIALAAERSDGNPLYAEELARVMREDGEASLGAMPNTLHDLLISRLDRIPEAHALAQVAATIGRQIPHDLLRAVAGGKDETFRANVDALLEAGIWEPGSSGQFATYRFHHSLVQEAAYQSQLKVRRREVHDLVARTLLEQFPERMELEPHVVAHHLERASRNFEAVAHWQRAGAVSAARGAHAEAVNKFQHGLELLVGEVKASPERNALELGLQLGLGASLSTTRGYGAPEVESAFARARSLCGSMGGSPDLFAAVWGSWTFYLIRGDYEIAARLAADCKAISDELGDHALQIESANAVGLSDFYMGRLEEAQRSLELCTELYRREPAVSPGQRFQHPAVTAMSHLAVVLWMRGQADQARTRMAEALEMAETCEERLRGFARSYAESFAGWLGGLLHDATYSLEHAQATIDVCHEFGWPMFLAAGEMHKGAAQAELGDPKGGLKRLVAALEGFRLTGANLLRPYFQGRLAEIYAQGGQAEKALAIIEDALDLIGKNGERVCEPELLRLRGTLGFRAGLRAAEDSRRDLEQAMRQAAAQGARMLELRAAASLAEIDGTDDSRRRVEQLRSSFSQGLDLPELR